jgi:hypothetical protein
MRKDGKVGGGGACGAPPASIPLPTVAVVAPLPQWLVGRGQAGARLAANGWAQAPGMGKGSGVAGEVHFIAVWTCADVKRLRPAFNLTWNQSSTVSRSKSSFLLPWITPPLDCLLNFILQRTVVHQRTRCGHGTCGQGHA